MNYVFVRLKLDGELSGIAIALSDIKMLEEVTHTVNGNVGVLLHLHSDPEPLVTEDTLAQFLDRINMLQKGI